MADLAVYVPWCQSLGTQIVKHNFHFHSVTVEALIHVGRLYEVTNVGHSVGMLGE